MRSRAALLAAAILALAPPASPAGRAPSRHLTLVYVADLGGYLEPCGCSQAQRGGLPRAATVLARLRAENPETVFLGGGDLLFETPLAPERREQELAKARAVAAALKRMGLAAAVHGERDLYAGQAFARSTGLPFTQGTRLGLLGFGDLGKVPRAPVKVAVVHEGGTRAALPLAERARRQGVALLLASHRDSLLDDDFNRALLDAPVPVVQVQGRGQSLARIDLFLRGDPSKGFVVLRGAAQRDEELDLIAERRVEYDRRRAAAEVSGNAPLAEALSNKIDELTRRERALRETPLPEPPSDRPSLVVSFIPVTEDIPEDRAVRVILTRYYGQIARANLAAARSQGRPCPDPRRDEPAFIGVDETPRGGSFACKTCHAGAYAFWEATPHSQAYRTLAERGREFDLDCVGCHVTGWRQPGGACTVGATEGRRDVQCESCHGPASLHALDPPRHIQREVPEQACRRCHTPEASTRFEYTSYRARVLGQGHGESVGKRTPGR
jgi:hypothetical protein